MYTQTIEAYKRIIKQTFPKYAANRLPSKCEWDLFKEDMISDPDGYSLKIDDYRKNNFSILTSTLIKKIVIVILKYDIEKIAELACGPGWLSFWLTKYGSGPIVKVDNHLWAEFFNDTYMKSVIMSDASQYVKEHPETELFILSWPHFNTNIASEIWLEMKPGQMLLYIGEDKYGCCAEERFFDYATGNEMEEESKILSYSHTRFRGFHDNVILYRKEG